MDWNAIYPGPEEPTAEQLSAYVSHPMWEPLNRWICEAYSLSPIYSYSSCSMGPVSYTHLDVYKRQVIGRQGRIAKEIRTLMRSVAQRQGTKVSVEIVD